MNHYLITAFLMILSVGGFSVVIILRLIGRLSVGMTYFFISLTTYILSFLQGFSVGKWVMLIAFTTGTLALGRLVNFATTNLKSIFTFMVGVVLWFVSTYYVDEYWIYIPFSLLLP